MTVDRLVSVVVPARNAEKTLRQTLESLLAQTDSRWEALVVDDGSVDGTATIIADYAARESRFVGLRSTRRGVSAARNFGISNASGERILFLDSDDWIHPYFLAKMNAALDGYPSATAAYCNFCRVMPDGSETPVYVRLGIEKDPFETFARTNATAIHGVLVKKSAVLKVGGFDPALLTCEEWDLWQRIARAGGTWIHVNEKLSFYRASDHSLTHDVQQILADADIVIARGFCSDDRVDDPAPVHRAGATPAYGSAPTAYAYFALWCAGFDCGRRKRADASQDTLADLPKTEDTADTIASVLLDSVVVGIRATPAKLAELWGHYGPGVTDLITAIGRAWDDPSAARKVQYGFERLVLDHDDLSAPRPLALTCGIRVDLRRLHTLRPPNNIDRLYVYLCHGPRILTVLDVGVLGEIERHFWTRLIAEHLDQLRIGEMVGRLDWQKIKTYKRTRQFRTFLLGEQNTHRNRLRALQVRMFHRAISPPVSSIAASHSGARRSELARTETRQHMPVLKYHRVATEGPEELARYRVSPGAFREQILWLRRNGYHTINSGQFAWFAANNCPISGRPVLITFDDGYEEFAEQAWPILQANDLSAEVFIATDFVGKRAEWDASIGTPAPLMDAAKIVALAAEGVSFGSHLASRPRSDQLSTRELAEELVRSRAQLTKWMGRPVTSLAAPFGCTDQRLRILAAECGYKTAFNMVNRAARLQDDLLDLPRIEVRADFTLEGFARCLEQYQ